MSEEIETFSINQLANERFALLRVARSKGYIIIDRSYVKGWIKHIDLEPGLSLQVWNLEVKSNTLFERRAQIKGEQVFVSAYFTEPENMKLVVNSRPEQELKEPARYNFTLSSNSSFESLVTAGCHVKCVSLNFTLSFLAAQMPEGFSLPAIDPCYTSQLQPLFLIEPVEKNEQIYTKTLFDYACANSQGLLLKSIVYHLLAKSVERLAYCSRLTPQSIRDDGEQLIIQLEKKINDSLLTNLPPIEEMAKELYVSPSTLKRYFKKAFGKNIYNYYLEKKMELAKSILQKGKLNVSQTATYLGYENTSHFTTVFKKMCGCSPNTLRKNAQ